MTIEVKNAEVLCSLMIHPVDPKLIEIICCIMENDGGVITEGFRIQRHRNDLHGIIPVRAIDLRSRDYSNPEEVESRINKMWEYDYNRSHKKVCVYHGSGLGKHFHIQVHPHTRRRN